MSAKKDIANAVLEVTSYDSGREYAGKSKTAPRPQEQFPFHCAGNGTLCLFAVSRFCACFFQLRRYDAS